MVPDGHSTSEPVPTSTLSDDLVEGTEAYADQQQGQCITLVYLALDGDLCDGLGVGFQTCFPKPQ